MKDDKLKNLKPKTAQELVQDNTIVKHLAGSHAYGTALPTSDVDYRGVFVADPINVRTPFFRVDEVEVSTEEDTKLYELSNFMKLALDCNPNVVETLWVDMKDCVITTPAYEHLRKHAPLLLSSKIAFTTSGYALAQLKRIRGHNKWINCPQPEEKPQQVDFVSMVQHFAKEGEMPTMPRAFNLRNFVDGWRLVPFGKDTYGLYRAEGRSPFNKETGNLNDDFEDESRAGLGAPEYIVKLNKQEYEDAKVRHEQYWSWKRNRNDARGELEEQFGYDCYTDDTEFLTNNGWKKFDDVSENDTLATFNPLSHKVEYQVPREKIQSLYTGNMYHLTGFHVDVMVSANHNMYVRSYSRTNRQEGQWGFERAAELSETFDTLNVINPKTNRQLLPKGVNQQLFQHVDLLNYLRLVGWYVSEGTMQFYGADKVKAMVLSQSKPQSRLTQNLTRQINSGKVVCKQYMYEARELGQHPERRWFFDRELSQIIYDDCGHGSAMKRLPEWCFFLTKREMTTLLVALLQGDGTKKNHQKHTYVYYTINPLLADDVQRLALLCGFETSKYGPYEINSTFNTINQMYHVHISMRPKKTRRHVRSAAIQKVSVVNQRIVCFMVDNYTLITRRNGHVGFHGNTKHAMHLVRLLRMGREALVDGVINVKRPDAEELLAIRAGKWTYEEVVKYAEEMDREVREVLYEKTSLPKKPNIKLAAQLVIEVQDMVWSS